MISASPLALMWLIKLESRVSTNAACFVVYPHDGCNVKPKAILIIVHDLGLLTDTDSLDDAIPDQVQTSG